MKKHKYIIGVVIAVLLAIPILLNILLQIPAIFPIVGESIDWLMFWPTYLGAAASFGMIVLTRLTLKQNEEQLDELKHQWEEEHRPQISAHIFEYDQLFYIRIKNISKVPILNLKISISSNPYEEKVLNYDKWKRRLAESTFSIDPSDCINIEVFASCFRGEQYHDTIGLHFEFNNKYVYDAKLSFDEACFCKNRFEEQALLESIKKMSDSVIKVKME